MFTAIKKVSVTLLFLMVLVLTIKLVTFYTGNLANGYSLEGYDQTNWHIKRRGDIVIGTSVVDVMVVSGFIVGLRLPSESVLCDQGGDGQFLHNIMNGESEYFVINTDSNSIQFFDEREKFERHISTNRININLADLDFQRLVTILNSNRKRHLNRGLDCIAIDTDENY